jgi:hypothetical protein
MRIASALFYTILIVGGITLLISKIGTRTSPPSPPTELNAEQIDATANV